MTTRNGFHSIPFPLLQYHSSLPQNIQAPEKGEAKEEGLVQAPVSLIEIIHQELSSLHTGRTVAVVAVAENWLDTTNTVIVICHIWSVKNTNEEFLVLFSLY